MIARSLSTLWSGSQSDMYDLIGYGSMIADEARTEAYASALRTVIDSQSVVLDIGSGTGLFALLACRFGARRVYAIEPNDAIALAREIAEANGFADRITFFQGMSERTTLPEMVDVIVSDIRGVLPLYGRSVHAILDARRRMLAPGGTLIPRRDRLMAALVEAPNLYEKHDAPWNAPVGGVDMSSGRRFATNSWHIGRATADQLLVEAACWVELDYTILESPDARGEIGWIAKRQGVAHGLSIWFESELAPGVRLSNAPDRPALVYGSTFFPLSEPVSVAEGDRIDVGLRADLIGDDYIWSWNTKIYAPGSTPEIRAEFRQSSFFSSPVHPTQLHKRAAGYRPTLSEDGEIALLILKLMRERCTLEHIARRVSERFPSRFPDWPEALGHVGRFSGEYSETPSDAIPAVKRNSARKNSVASDTSSEPYDG